MSDFFASASAVGSTSGGQPAPVSPAAPPAWYPDPHQPHQLRWFDGYQWTEHSCPMSQSPTGYAAWSGPPQRDRSMEALLPVNRTGLAIAAGYVGLFSILLIFAPIALLLGVLALVDLKDKPDVGGRGRAWFAIVAGVLGTVGLIAVIAR